MPLAEANVAGYSNVPGAYLDRVDSETAIREGRYGLAPPTVCSSGSPDTWSRCRFPIHRGQRYGVTSTPRQNATKSLMLLAASFGSG